MFHAVKFSLSYLQSACLTTALEAVPFSQVCLTNICNLGCLPCHGHVVDADLLTGLDNVHSHQQLLAKIRPRNKFCIWSAGVVGHGNGGAEGCITRIVHGICVERTTVEVVIKGILFYISAVRQFKEFGAIIT